MMSVDNDCIDSSLGLTLSTVMLLAVCALHTTYIHIIALYIYLACCSSGWVGEGDRGGMISLTD